MKVPQPVIRFEKSYNRPHCFTESHVNFVVRMAPVNASIAYKLCGMFGVADDKVKIGVFFAGLHHRDKREFTAFGNTKNGKSGHM